MTPPPTGLPERLRLCNRRFIENADYGYDGESIGEVCDKDARGKAIAAELVRRYNAHEKMREALTRTNMHLTQLLARGDFADDDIPLTKDWHKQVKQALAAIAADGNKL